MTKFKIRKKKNYEPLLAIAFSILMVAGVAIGGLAEL